MISRIRLDLYGRKPSEIERHVRYFIEYVTPEPQAGTISSAAKVTPVFSAPMIDEFVIERNLPEPEDSAFAYRGRVIMHPSITTDGEPPAMPEPVAA